MMEKKKARWSELIPGLLVAATGVGAGDLITASLAGSEVGIVVLWAVVLGALFKWALNEGIARWQLATQKSLVEGWLTYLPLVFSLYFALYFFLWSYAVGGALVNACGVAGVGFWSRNNPHLAKIIWGIVHSLTGLVIVWFGGFRVFQYVMSFFIALMVISVITTACLMAPSLGEVINGLIVPQFPQGGTSWLLGVLGGVGGTVTLLSYGYWIKEKGRKGKQGLRWCRFDLGIGYSLTALFGLSMVIIGSRIKVQGKGAIVALLLAEQLTISLGTVGRWIFLLGFWAAVFTSLLGVWQSVPYIFSDFFAFFSRQIVKREKAELERSKLASRSYRIYLIGLATIPLSLLWFQVQMVQLLYAVLGALFMPFLSLTLLLLNNQKRLVGQEFKASWLINGLLVAALLLFLIIGLREIGFFPM